MKLFSALKPRLNNTSAAKCYKARTVTRWLLFIIFLEKTAINICRFPPFSLGKCSYVFWFSYFVLSLHFSGWWDIIDSSYWSECGNNNFVIVFSFYLLFESNVLKSLLLWCPCCYETQLDHCWLYLSVHLSRCLTSCISRLKQTWVCEVASVFG